MSDEVTLADYLARKHEAEMRAEGYSMYASVQLRHVCPESSCGGLDFACRVVTKEWRKPRNKKRTRYESGGV